MVKVTLLLLLTTACAPPAAVSTRHVFQGSTMGTTFTVTVVGPLPGSVADRLRGDVEVTLAQVDGAMSTYDPDSELSRFNRWRRTDWFALSPPTFEVFRHAQEVSRLTQGAFDVTVAPLVDAWGFGATGPVASVPTDTDVKALLADVGQPMLEMDDDARRIRKSRPAVQSDLSALAKGYAVDRVAALLDGGGDLVEGYLVEVGGEVRARGRNEDGRRWRVGIERPVDGPPSIQRILALTDAALATSGDYRNFFEHEGRRYSHTIDPRTGYPVDHGLASVSVVAESCVRADALATALEVLGPEAGFALAQEQGWAVLLITREADGTLTEQTTAGFPALSP